jgi:ribose transport system permease protein
VTRIRELPTLVVLGAVLVWLVATRPAFHTPVNLSQVGQQAGVLGILACGEGLVILTGGIDLSIGAIVAMASCAGAAAMTAGHAPWPVAALVALGVGALAGWINGALITWRGLTPILTTLATLLVFRAVTNIATGALPYTQLPDSFKAIGHGNGPLAVCVVLVAALALVLARARFGRRLVALGGSETAARLSGISTDAVLRRVYIAAGICAALAGLLMSAASNNAQWDQAEGAELEMIAAVAIGGIRLTGGQGSIVGAALGACIIVVLRNGLFLSGVPNEQYGLITGAVIVVAALAEQMRRSRELRVA